jgi:hypothetical protein
MSIEAGRSDLGSRPGLRANSATAGRGPSLPGMQDDRYSQRMALQPDTQQRRSVIIRIGRWKPASNWQVWVMFAPIVASGVLVGGLVAGLIGGGFAVGRFLPSLPAAAVSFVGCGAIESYRLGRRRDAATYPEWLEARGRPRAE